MYMSSTGQISHVIAIFYLSERLKWLTWNILAKFVKLGEYCVCVQGRGNY